MGKKQRERVLPSNAAQAVAKNIRVSPIKLNQVASSIRGMKAEKAMAELAFSRKRISNEVLKVLESAIANAENNDGADVDELRVSRICVDEGPTMKRWRARARGRAAKILKRTSHVTVAVEEAGQ